MNIKSAIFIAAIVVSLIMAISFANADDYDVTRCVSGTANPLFSSEKLTIFTFELKGITRSNTSEKDFDNDTFQCVGIGRVSGKEVISNGNCKKQSPDGSIYVNEFNEKNGEGTDKFLYGTNRYEGIEGGGPYKPITKGKPITPGTFQSCSRATGTFNLKK